MHSPVEEIKSRIDIVTLIEGYVRLHKAGSAFKALCPFHQEKSPSFTVSPARQSYHCFGCNRGGDIFSFVEEMEGVDFAGALKILADRAGVELKPMNKAASSERERLVQLMEAATLFYENELKPSHPAYAYLTSRGLKPETIKKFRLGFAPAGWRGASDHLKKLGFTDDEIEKAGLSKQSDKATDGNIRRYDRFRSRIMFPLADGLSRTIGFSGRIFPPNAGQEGGGEPNAAKYINSPETILYDKSSVLFGLDKAKVAMRKQNFCIIVEGQIDLVMAHQAGTENTVAVSGTALTEKHMALIKRLTENVVFAFDQDAAGISATGKAFQLALAQGMKVRVAKLPKGVDPADVILSDVKVWNKAVLESKHIINYLLETIMDGQQDPLKLRLDVEKTVLPYLLYIPSAIEQAHFVLEIARIIGIPDNAVWESLGKVRLATSYGKPVETPSHAPTDLRTPKSRVHEELVGMILWQRSESTPRIDIAFAESEFTRLNGKALDDLELSEAERNQSIVRVEHTYTSEHITDTLIKELIDRLELLILEERQSELSKALMKAENDRNIEEATEILTIFQEVSTTISKIKSRRNNH